MSHTSPPSIRSHNDFHNPPCRRRNLRNSTFQPMHSVAHSMMDSYLSFAALHYIFLHTRFSFFFFLPHYSSCADAIQCFTFWDHGEPYNFSSFPLKPRNYSTLIALIILQLQGGLMMTGCRCTGSKPSGKANENKCNF